MPTANPRVNVTLSPSTDALVTRLAGLQRVSKSQVLRELLEVAEPGLQRAAALMEAANGAHQSVLDELSRSMEVAQDKAEATLAANLQADLDTTRDLFAEVEAVRGRRPAREAALAAARVGRVERGGAENPPASNRGVKSSKRVHKSGNEGGQK